MDARVRELVSRVFACRMAFIGLYMLRSPMFRCRGLGRKCRHVQANGQLEFGGERRGDD